MRSSLYRTCTALCISVLVLGMPLAAQRKKPPKGPRAIAVVRWQVDEKGSARPFLIPILILVEDKIYDAGLYRPSPRPFALDPGTLYEAQDKGELLGLFTVESAVRGKGTAAGWIGLGKWKSEAPGLEFDPAAAIKERPQARSTTVTAQVPDDGTPTNKKKKVVYDEQGRPIENPSDDDDQPARDRRENPEPLERRPQIAKEPTKVETKPTAPDDDPDRPRLKRGKPDPAVPPPPSAGTAAVTAAPKPDDDPDRPILKRGKPGAQKQTEETSTAGPVPYRVERRGAQSSSAGKIYDVVAISDADTSGTPKDYRFRAGDDERQELQTKMQTLAQQALAAYLQPAAAPKRSARPLPPAGLEDVRFAMFDLDSNNSAELVFTARHTLADASHVYVTLVARTDVNSNPRVLFTQVTRDRDLDIKPRLELVDAVDLTNDGPAELLFRQTSADGSAYILYRVGLDRLEPLFRGGAAD
jgi:hypothetical protein